MHIYEEVAKDLKQKIINGEYDAVGKLETEFELIEKYKVSKNTIRKAIDVLVNAGFIYKVQGSGVYLRDIVQKNFRDVPYDRALFSNVVHSETTVKLVTFEVIQADKKLAQKLKCDEKTEVYHVIRIRYYNDEPFEIEESFFNKDIIFYLNEEICKNSIFAYIEKDLKLNNKFADRTITCRKLNKKEADILNLEENDPCMVLENVTFLSNGRIFDYSTDIYNYKLIKLYKADNY